MKYIRESTGNGYDLGEYLNYIEQNILKFPPMARKYVANSDVFEMYSELWIHDAQFISFNINQIEINSLFSIKADLSFLNRSSKKMTFSYEDIMEYDVKITPENKWNKKGGHGDVRIGEVRMEENIVVHEICFYGGSYIEVKCRDFLFSIS